MLPAMWTVDSDDPRAVVGRFGSVGVAVLHDALDEPFFDRLRDTLDALASEHSRYSAMVIRANEVPGSMPKSLREKATRTLSSHKANLRGFAYVLGGSGLKAKMVRGAMNAVLVTMPFDAKIFADVPSATRWLTGLAGQPPEVASHEAALRETIDRLCRR